MLCAPGKALVCEQVGSIDALPADAASLFGEDFFSTLSWYRVVAATALPAGSAPGFVLVRSDGRTLAVLPMLFTPYTCIWQPLLVPGLDLADLHAIGGTLARFWRGAGTIRLDALDLAQVFWAPLLDGLRANGLRALPFDHFGNWHLPVAGQSWATYLAARPGALRESIRRHTRRLIDRDGAVFTIVAARGEVEQAIAVYEKIYAASWKPAEPFAEFIPALIRACAADGSLRLGLLSVAGAPIAVQLWTLHGGIACVHKLAHDSRHDSASPGTVLTAQMIGHLLNRDSAEELDFGRGDDAYKQLWTGARRQRSGLILANPWLPSGAIAIARHTAAAMRRRMAA